MFKVVCGLLRGQPQAQFHCTPTVVHFSFAFLAKSDQPSMLYSGHLIDNEVLRVYVSQSTVLFHAPLNSNDEIGLIRN